MDVAEYAMKEKRKSNTGIPIQLKKRIEENVGLSFDDVCAYYNPELPAKPEALGYTRGHQIEVAPGQEQCLPHELGHVVQQKLGLVRVNARHSSGVVLNTDEVLESQADETEADQDSQKKYPDRQQQEEHTQFQSKVIQRKKTLTQRALDYAKEQGVIMEKNSTEYNLYTHLVQRHMPFNRALKCVMISIGKREEFELGQIKLPLVDDETQTDTAETQADTVETQVNVETQADTAIKKVNAETQTDTAVKKVDAETQTDTVETQVNVETQTDTVEPTYAETQILTDAEAVEWKSVGVDAESDTRKQTDAEIKSLYEKVKAYAQGLTRAERKPAVAGVYNRKTGKYFYATNSPDGAIPSPLHELLEIFIKNMPEDVKESYEGHTRGCGSHAEIIALNNALQDQPDTSPNDLMVCVIHGDGKLEGEGFQRCPHCMWISQIFYAIYG